MLQVIKTAGESDITNGLLGIAQQSFCLVQANTQQVLVGRYAQHGFEDPAEMEWAGMAMLRQLLQGDILPEMMQQEFLRPLNGRQVI